MRLLTIIALFVLSLGVVAAQDTEGRYVAPEGTVGSMMQDAEAGMLNATEDGYTLTLSGLDANLGWVLNTPELFTYRYTMENLVSTLEFADEMALSAVLNLDDVTIDVTLSAPEFDIDANTVTFAATVEGATGIEEGKSGLELPEAFGESTLFILLNAESTTQLINAHNDRITSMRPGLPCIPNGAGC